jgi:hypothetical protein
LTCSVSNIIVCVPIVLVARDSLSVLLDVTFIQQGEPIPTDLVDEQHLMSSLSSNGKIVALANNNSIQVYQQNMSLSTEITWIPLGSSLVVEAESPDIDGQDGISFFLAPDALVLAVGIPTFQNGAGRVGVYE